MDMPGLLIKARSGFHAKNDTEIFPIDEGPMTWRLQLQQ